VEEQHAPFHSNLDMEAAGLWSGGDDGDALRRRKRTSPAVPSVWCVGRRGVRTDGEVVVLVFLLYPSGDVPSVLLYPSDGYNETLGVLH
jgi:hypothetical protein